MSLEVLAQIQFIFTIGFNILWSAFAVGLCVFLFVCEVLWLKTKNKEYVSIYMFWAKIFAISFAMVVITSIPIAFQFGINFAQFSEFVSPVLNCLRSVEGIAMFLLEFVCIIVMLFGWKNVHPIVHLCATGIVMIGIHVSILWVLIASSWMQTPAGVDVINGVLHVMSWKEVVFNASMPYYVTHTLFASYISAFFIILGVSASYLVTNSMNILAKKAFNIAFGMLYIVLSFQIIVGFWHGLNSFKYHPEKVLTIPDIKNEKGKLSVAISNDDILEPMHTVGGGSSNIEGSQNNGKPTSDVVLWLDIVECLMIFTMFCLLVWGLTPALRKQVFVNVRYLRLISCMMPIGFIAMLVGMCITCIDMWPWSVYGMLRVMDSYSMVLGSFVYFNVVFCVVLYCILIYFYAQFIKLIYKKNLLPVGGVNVHSDYNI